MPRRHVPADKNPNHPSALRLRDLTPGRTIIPFNTMLRKIHPYTVLTHPYVKTFLDGHMSVVVLIRSNESGYTLEEHCDYLGVIPYHTDDWDETSFVIDHRKARLLPVTMQLLYRGDREFEDELEDDYYWWGKYPESDPEEDHDDLDQLEDLLDVSDWDHIDDLNRDAMRRHHDDDLLLGDSPYVRGTDKQVAILRRKIGGSIDD